MKRFALSLLIASVAGIGTAAAEDICNVPQAEWQPKEALQQKLVSEGWTIKAIKIDEGCYEVYGKDAAGQRMETYFDPKSFAVMKQD
ncbi:PepSY domain-containing protein [Dongia sp.]|uniref:PepSY domain-containing protein n=1 Tax=Dongia sp. TaxID=1977262 RepID=UPI0037513265